MEIQNPVVLGKLRSFFEAEVKNEEGCNFLTKEKFVKCVDNSEIFVDLFKMDFDEACRNLLNWAYSDHEQL